MMLEHNLREANGTPMAFPRENQGFCDHQNPALRM
jgi:hypothetical protein